MSNCMYEEMILLLKRWLKKKIKEEEKFKLSSMDSRIAVYNTVLNKIESELDSLMYCDEEDHTINFKE